MGSGGMLETAGLGGPSGRLIHGNAGGDEAAITSLRTCGAAGAQACCAFHRPGDDVTQSPAPADPANDSCANCGAVLTGPYCAQCGQSRASPAASLRAFTYDFVAHVISTDARFIRSVRALFLQPGRLTRAYLDGHRVRYSSPLQLYFVAAALFFLVSSFRPFIWVDTADLEVVGALPGMTVGNDVTSAHLQRLAGSDHGVELFAERFIDAVNAWLPAFLLGSVLLFALAVYALHFRRSRHVLPHAIFALHWAAFYLLLVGAARLTPEHWVLQHATVPVGVVWLAVALRHAYRQSWLAAGTRAVALMFVFLFILVLWVQSAVSIGMLAV